MMMMMMVPPLVALEEFSKLFMFFFHPDYIKSSDPDLDDQVSID